jgi:hypothetical protein
MAGKTYIKTGNAEWSRVKKIYLKTGGITWQAIRKAYLKTGVSTWRKIYDTTSNRPFIGNDIPKIRLNTFRTNSTTDFTGTANDPVNPVVEAPPVQQMGPPTTTPTVGWTSGTVGNHLWGYDGTWTSGNGSTITFIYQWLYNLTGNSNDNRFDPQFYVSGTSSSINTSSTGRADMLTNSASYLGYNDGDYFDKNFITFRVGASNSAGGPVFAESTPVYIVRQKPSGTINLINTSVDVPETLSASITYQDEWYRKPDLANSYVEWFAIDSVGEALTTSNRVAIQYLNTVSTTGTTTKSGTVYHNATLANKIYSVRITLNNSNTQAAVIPISGFTPNSAFTQEDSTSPGSALEVTSLDILDYYSNEGTDNRGYIPVGGLFKINSTVTGVDGSTTYRIRYRMYNIQNSSYYGMDGTNYGAAASSAWTTRTGSSTSSGFGGTLINQISISGTTATLIHNEVISSSIFGSTTYSIDGVGGYDRWFIEIEVSALKNSVRKYYLDFVGGISYYVSRPATLSLTASPENAQVNETVTLSGSVSALGGGNSYPRQYKIDFGDGTADSGWLPVGEYAYGTSNPSFSITKQYSAVGEYYPNVRTIPDYSSATAYVNVSAALTAPTSTSIVSMSRLNDTTVRAVIGSSGGSGPYYQLYWTSGVAPTTASYDAAGTTSTVTEDFSFSNGITYYFYMRSSNQNLGDTIVNGTATAGTYSAYGGSASYTFAQPSGTMSVSPSSGTAGSTQFTATPSISSAPNAQVSYQWQYFEGGSFGWVALSGATSSTYTPPSNYVSIYGSNLRCQITANNGVGNTLTLSANATVAAAASKLSTPSNVAATDNLSTGIRVSWTNVSNAATYGVWWGGQPGYDSSPDFGGPNNNGGKTITGTPFLDDGVSTGTTRDYYVQAFPASGSTSFLKSDWSLGDSGTRVAAATAPTGGSVSVNPTTGTAGSTTYTASTSGWTGSGTITYSYSWQRFTNGVFSYQEIATGPTFSPTVGQNSSALAWLLVVTASNGVSPNGTASTSFTVNNPVASTPSTPGTPTLTYVPANNTSTTWGYSASWGASTGTGTIQYQIDGLGSSGGSATLGLYGTNSASFNLSRNDNLWQIRVRATNNGGSTWSSYSGYSNSA